jgi:hypothetical protein
MVPVVYMGGCCGDLITGMLDLRDVGFDIAGSKMRMPLERQRLKQPYTFASDQEKDHYLQHISLEYTSVPSHDLEYHVSRAHWFLGIRVQDPDIARWAAQRFQQTHRPQVWHSVKKAWNIDNTEQYAQLLLDWSSKISAATPNILDLEDIVSGHIVPVLEHHIGRELERHAVNCYRNWQHIQNGTFLA